MQHFICDLLDLLIHFVDDHLQRLPVQDALRDQPLGKFDDRVTSLLGCALGFGFVEALVIRKRMRIGSGDHGMHQRRTLSGARMRHRFSHGLIRRHEIGAVHFHPLQIRKTRHQSRDVSARRLLFHRHRDGVAIVLDQIHQRQILQAGSVQRFPKLALTGGAFAARYQRHFVGRRVEKSIGLRATGRLHELRPSGRRSGNDVQLRRAPMGGHLAATRAGIGRRSHRTQQRLLGRDAQHQAQGAIAIVRVEPVVAGPQNQARGSLHGLVSGAANLEENSILPLQQNLPIVKAARHVHRAISSDEIFPRGRGIHRSL